RIGVPPHPATPSPISGVSWLAVEQTASFPSFPTHSQAHPDPNRPAAAAANFSLKASNDPNAWLIASASSPVGAPPPPLPAGAMIVQNREWLTCPPTLFRAAVRRSSGTSFSRATTCSGGRSARGVPSRALLALVT